MYQLEQLVIFNRIRKKPSLFITFIVKNTVIFLYGLLI